MANISPSLNALASQISLNADVVTKFLEQGAFKGPSFAPGGDLHFPEAPENVAAARMELVGAARQLYYLARWPAETLQSTCMQMHDISALRWLNYFKIPSAVPLEGTASFTKIAEITGVERKRLTRVLRHAMTDHVFCEPEHGRVAHTAMSAALAQVKPSRDVVGYLLEEGFPSSAKFVEATTKFTDSTAANETAFNLAFDTDIRSLDWIDSDALRADRFAGAMKSLASNPSHDVQHLVDGYDWNGLGRALVVDIGGSTGQASIAIARRAPQLRFIVQDLAEVIKQGSAEVPVELRTRISFMVHDFFNANPEEAADVFLLRMICHDWPEQDCVRILQSVASRMSSSSKLIVNDIVLPPPGKVPSVEEKGIRGFDMHMMTMFNAAERSLEDWENLLSKIEPKIRIEKVSKPSGSSMSVVDIRRSE